ncbi:MAG: hypothetical protein ACRCUY_11200 [Thermoguttaceae bacterium]
MYQQLILRWLVSQIQRVIKTKIYDELTKSSKTKTNDVSDSGHSEFSDSAVFNGSCDSVSRSTDVALNSKKPSAESKSDDSQVDIGFVFAMPMEAAGVVDQLKRHKKTCGNGRVFHTGLFNHLPVAIVEAGIGQKKARQSTEVLIDVFRPKRILSAGYSGGLVASQNKFAVIFPEFVIRESDGKMLDLKSSIPTMVLKDDETKNGTDKRLENPATTLLTTNFIVSSPKNKKELAKKYGAELVDMETFAIAEMCMERQIPFLSARIVLDTSNESLPKDVQIIMKNVEKGGIRLVGSILGSVCRRPSSMTDLYRLKEDALRATDRLAKKIAARIAEKIFPDSRLQ